MPLASTYDSVHLLVELPLRCIARKGPFLESFDTALCGECEQFLIDLRKKCDFFLILIIRNIYIIRNLTFISWVASALNEITIMNQIMIIIKLIN